MKRREFVGAGLAAGAAAVLPAGDLDARRRQTRAFSMSFAPHFGMFRELGGRDPIDQIRFMAEQGFRALEDNGMRDRSTRVQERIASELGRLGMRMGVFVGHTIDWNEPTLTTGDGDRRSRFLAEIRESVDVARRVNATWMTVVPGYVDLRRHLDYQTADVVESLKQAAGILEPHGLVMVLEPLNPRDHPGLFLRRIGQASQICQAVGSPSCKILDDLYHQQVTEGNLIPNIDAAWDEIAYFQIGDNPGRREPTTGEINFASVFRHIRDKGYTGILGMEHGNARGGAEGERAVIEVYRSVDPGR